MAAFKKIVLTCCKDDLKESDDGEDLAQRSDSNVAVNDDIIELTELDLADFNPGVLSVVGALKSFTTPEILTAQNAYECEKCCPSKKKVFGGEVFRWL